jgi:hypothetical protein
MNTLVAYEVSISEGIRPIRADFISKLEGENGLGIVELKEIETHSEREIFTELLAYSSCFHQQISGLSVDDLVLVLITPMNEQITQHAYINSLLFDGKQSLHSYLVSDQAVAWKLSNLCHGYHL